MTGISDKEGSERLQLENDPLPLETAVQVSRQVEVVKMQITLQSQVTQSLQEVRANKGKGASCSSHQRSHKARQRNRSLQINRSSLIHAAGVTDVSTQIVGFLPDVRSVIRRDNMHARMPTTYKRSQNGNRHDLTP